MEMLVRCIIEEAAIRCRVISVLIICQEKGGSINVGKIASEKGRRRRGSEEKENCKREEVQKKRKMQERKGERG